MPRVASRLTKRAARLESIQIGEDEWMWSSGGIDDLINHSCAPNSSLLSRPDGLWVVAIEDIPAMTELTYDYSTGMLNDPLNPPMACVCGALGCRGTIVNFLDLPAALQKRYAAHGVLPAFIRRAAAAKGVDLPEANPDRTGPA